MKDRPLVSVVIPCYNYGRFLAECLSSVLAQQGPSCEVIVVDDASTDDTREVVGRFLADPRVACIRHERTMGHLASASEGLVACRGEFLMRLDADDYLAPGVFSRSLAVFAQYPEVALSYGNYCLVDEHSRVQVHAADRIHKGKDFKGNELSRLIFDNYICPPTAMVRRKAWEALGLQYDPAVPYSEDWWVWLRLGLAHEFHYSNAVCGNYRVHPRSIRKPLVEQGHAESSHRYILGHFFSIPGLPRQLSALRRPAYARQCRWFADAYFACGRLKDSARCLRESLRWEWTSVFFAGWWRRATLLALPAPLRRAVKRLYAYLTGKL